MHSYNRHTTIYVSMSFFLFFFFCHISFRFQFLHFFFLYILNRFEVLEEKILVSLAFSAPTKGLPQWSNSFSRFPRKQIHFRNHGYHRSSRRRPVNCLHSDSQISKRLPSRQCRQSTFSCYF